MNQVTLIGNLGKDPETKTFGDKSKTTFTVATSDGYGDNKKTNWHSCEAWNKQGEVIAKHLKKGDKIAVIGSIDYSEYDGKYYTNIKVDRFEFVGGKMNSEMTPSFENSEDPLPF